MKKLNIAPRLGKKFFVSLLSLVLAMAVMVTASFAWLTNFWDSNNTNFGFTTGTVEYPDIHMWTFLTEEEGSENESGEWVDATERIVTDPDNHTSSIPGVTESAFQLKDLHLGTVDNLVTLKNDNIVYLRFDVKKSMGTKFHVKIMHADHEEGVYDFTVYSYENGEITIIPTDEMISEETSLYDHMESIVDNEATGAVLNVTYATSLEAYSPSDQAFADLTFSSDVSQPENVEENYYIYVRMIPNFNKVAEISQDLYAYMPCVVLFDLTIYYEIYTPVTPDP